MLIQTITWKSLPIQPNNIFTAPFAAGFYNFGAQPGNQDQIVIPLTNKYLYLIDIVNFSTSINAGDYLEAIQLTPSFSLRFQNTPYRIYPFPIPGVNYMANSPFSFWFHTEKGNDSLLISMNGILAQTPALVGVASITAQFSMVLYQEENNEKIQNMLRGTTQDQGNFYRKGI